MRYVLYIILMTLVLCIQSCSSHECDGIHCEHDYHYIVKKWLGKEVKIPDDYIYRIRDTAFDYDIDDADYKIVTYLDSTGCTACRMKLSDWNDVVNELKAVPDVSVNFVMILNSIDDRKTNRLLRVDNFRHPVVFDVKNEFATINELPCRLDCQTFLLDADNKIVALGNPTTNPKIRKLYKRIVAGESRHDSEVKSDIVKIGLCPRPSLSLGLLTVGDTVCATIELRNNDTVPIHIEDVVPSCGCVIAKPSTRLIAPAETASIDLSICPKDSSSAIFQQTFDIFYEEREKPETITIHGFIK